MRKKICIISTGGTILGSLNGSGYTSAKLDFKEVFSSFLASEFSKNCDFKLLEPFSVGSQDMSNENLLILMQTIKQNLSSNDAIIITHGTDTMEESAFLAFLLFHNAKIPITFCGAMYPPKHVLFDGEKNLKFAIISSFSAKGVFVAMNNNLIKANEVIKIKSVGADAFISVKSLISNPTDAEVENSKNSKLKNLNFSLPKSLAKVAIIYTDSTFEPFCCSSLDSIFTQDNASDTIKSFTQFYPKHFDGVVLAGMGAGTLNKNALHFFEKLKVPVVRSTRCAFSYVSSNGEVAQSAFIPSFSLNPAKSKILLSLAISNAFSKEKIQKYFEFFA